MDKDGDSKARKPIDTGDTPSVKALLDEVAIDTILNQGYTEDFFVQNVKILIGLLTCSCALVSQFYPKKFPENTSILVLCIISYMALSVLLQWFTSVVEQEVILFTKKTNVSESQESKKPQITLSTDLPRFQDKYKVMINAVTDTSEYPSFEREESITKWFDKKGNFAEDIFRKFTLDCLDQFRAGSQKKGQ